MIGFPKTIQEKKKYKGIRKIGKKGKRNVEVNKILHTKYSRLPEIPPCELQYIHCWHEFQGYAHRHERNWYLGREHLLSEISQTLKSCNQCHQFLDSHREEREKLFIRLRGAELLNINTT